MSDNFEVTQEQIDKAFTLVKEMTESKDPDKVFLKYLKQLLENDGGMTAESADKIVEAAFKEIAKDNPELLPSSRLRRALDI